MSAGVNNATVIHTQSYVMKMNENKKESKS